MAKTKTVRVIPFESIERRFHLASYNFFGKFCPAVDKKDNGYSIRVLKSETRYGANVNVTYDYFELDPEGNVETAPRGWARDFKPGRVTGLDEAVAKYAQAVA